jgi:hypothetical protein
MHNRDVVLHLSIGVGVLKLFKLFFFVHRQLIALVSSVFPSSLTDRSNMHHSFAGDTLTLQSGIKIVLVT